MLIYDALKKDHEKLKGLLNRLVALNPGDEDGVVELLGQIEDELIPHARAEESVFYNSLRSIDIPAAQKLVVHGYEEHIEAEAMLRDLQGMSEIGVDFKQTARKFKHAIEHHIMDEEGKIFSAAKQLLTDVEAEMMAQAFEELKPQVRESSTLQKTLDLVANMMPARFATPLRTFTFEAK